MRLSEAIRLGAMLRPQAYYWLYDKRNDGTCAFGAAAEAIGVLDKVRSGYTAKFPPAWKPVCEREPACPCCGFLLGDTQDVVIHLNNESRWTRERIADWVATLEDAHAPQALGEASGLEVRTD